MRTKRSVNLIILFLALAAVPALAENPTRPNTAALLRPVRLFVDAFNGHQADMPKDAFTNDCAIIDEFPGFVWTGPGAPAQWYATLMGQTEEKRAKKIALAEHLEVGEPKYVQTTADRAYFVLPSVLTWKQGGVDQKQTGEWVITENRSGETWRISSHAWAITSWSGK